MAKASDNKFPKLILEERLSDGSDTSNPAADHRALFLGEDGNLHLRDSSGTVTDIGGGGTDPAGTILAETVDTGGDRSITSASLANIPTTAITVTFTAPSTGNVDYELAATAGATTTQNGYHSWGILDNSNAVVAGAVGESIAVRQSSASAEQFEGVIKRFHETGLTPGNSYTRKWAAACSVSGGTLKANSNSPAIMRVVKAP